MLKVVCSRYSDSFLACDYELVQDTCFVFGRYLPLSNGFCFCNLAPRFGPRVRPEVNSRMMML